MMVEVLKKKQKSVVGVVSSRSGDKTVKMIYFYKTPHPRYHKEVKMKTVVHVHDEGNILKIGDKIEVRATRPLSKLKRWTLARVL